MIWIKDMEKILKYKKTGTNYVHKSVSQDCD